MFDEVKTQIKVPESVRVKTEATNLWKNLNLNLCFYHNARQWADYPNLSAAIHF